MSGTLEAEGSGTVTIRVAFRSVGIGFNVASACVEVSEVRRAISSAFVRCFRVTRAAVVVLVVQPREEQRCVTGLLSITAQCFGASGKRVMFIRYTTQVNSVHVIV